VVILSNKDDPEDIARGLAAGANGYLVKASTHHREVVWKVRECLAESKGEPVALRVAIRGSTLDAGHLAVLANQPPDLRCVTCGTALALELRPCADPPGRFEAQLLCPHCIP
jgi:DNA-binding NarL/FixJ family response regulator